MENRKLNKKEGLFCKEYLIDLNATQAAIRAGYSEKAARQIASRLLTKANIQQEVERLNQERVEKVEMDAVYVLSNLKEIIERCMQRAPVMVRKGRHFEQAQDEDGKHIWKFDAKNVNKALELVGKHLQMFPTNIKLAGDSENPLFAPIEVTIRKCKNSSSPKNKRKPTKA